jgi:hypothetical protein
MKMIVMASFLMSMFVAVAVGEAQVPFQNIGVPQQLDAIHLGIVSIAGTLGDFIAPDQSNARFTPPLITHQDRAFVDCSVTNVTSVNQNVQVSLFTLVGLAQTPSLVAQNTLELVPFGGGGAGGNGPGFFLCQFIVVGGSRSAIRASIQSTVFPLEAPAGAFVEAILPAE